MDNGNGGKNQPPDNLLHFHPKEKHDPVLQHELDVRLRLIQLAHDTTGRVTLCMMECAIRLLSNHKVKL